MVTKTSHLPIRNFLALLWAHPILHISTIRVKRSHSLTLEVLNSILLFAHCRSGVLRLHNTVVFRLSVVIWTHWLKTYYLLTPWSRVLLEKLTGSQLVKKFPAFNGTRRFNIAFTSSRHLSLSWASSIQSIPPRPTSWRSILILSSRLRLGLVRPSAHWRFFAQRWNSRSGCSNETFCFKSNI